jgi:hypothetical protein
MARADITVQALDPAGVFTAEQTGDSSNNHVLTNNGEVFLIARNADASNPHTVTVVTPGTVGGLAITDQAVVVASRAAVSQSRGRYWYFSESRYSSLPGRTGVFSQSS